MLHRMFPFNVLGNIAYVRMPLFTHTIPIKSLGLLNGLITVSLTGPTSISGKKMKMRVLAITFAVIAVEAQCRSITFAKVKEAEKENVACAETHRSARIHRDAKPDTSSSIWIEPIVSHNSLNLTDENAPLDTLEQLKTLITSYKENFAKFIEYAARTTTTKNNNQRELQFLDQPESLIEQLVEEQSRMKNTYSKADNVTDTILRTSNNKVIIKNANNLKDLFDTVKELDIVYQDGQIIDEHIRIKRAIESAYKTAASFATSDRKERVDNLLIDIQRQIEELWKYLDKLCKKRHTTSTSTSTISPEIYTEDNNSTVSQQSIDYLK